MYLNRDVNAFNPSEPHCLYVFELILPIWKEVRPTANILWPANQSEKLRYRSVFDIVMHSSKQTGP